MYIYIYIYRANPNPYPDFHQRLAHPALLWCSPQYLIVRLDLTPLHPYSVKCLWEVFVWGFGVVFLSWVCVGVGGVVLGRCVFV